MKPPSKKMLPRQSSQLPLPKTGSWPMKHEKVVVIPPPAKHAHTPQSVRGMKDILPADSAWWFWLFDTARDLAFAYGYDWVETPILEPAALFERTLGTTSDVVTKEMFSFTDTNGDRLVLRPEATASLGRLYLEHGMISQPQPVKMWYWGQMFRHERPQAGRYRQFHQVGFEALGSDAAVVDAGLIIVAHGFFKALGIDVTVAISSLGCATDREEYVRQLVEFTKPHKRQLCEDCQMRLVKNPLRMLDCKKEECQLIFKEAPQLIDMLDDACREHFAAVLEHLDEAEIAFTLTPKLVRGLDYYTRTVFEFWPSDDAEGARNALGGGGRYDNLLDILGGRHVPAVGFALGIERLLSRLRESAPAPGGTEIAPVFFAQLGEGARRRAFKIFEELRANGFLVRSAFERSALKGQLEMANRLGCPLTLILGQKEMLEGTIIVRDMMSGVQEIVNQSKLVPELRRRLAAPEAVRPSVPLAPAPVFRDRLPPRSENPELTELPESDSLIAGSPPGGDDSI